MRPHASEDLGNRNCRTREIASLCQISKQVSFALSATNGIYKNSSVEKIIRHGSIILRLNAGKACFGFSPHLPHPVSVVVNFGMVFRIPYGFGIFKHFHQSTALNLLASEIHKKCRALTDVNNLVNVGNHVVGKRNENLGQA